MSQHPIEAMKQALEALESKYIVNCGAWRVQQDQAITALKAALEQPEQEPLTDEAIEAVWKVAMFEDNGRHALLDNQPFVHFARAIEAAHGIKEKNT